MTARLRIAINQDFITEVTEVYVLIINDRHVDTEVAVFASRNDAIAAAEQETEERGWVTTGETARIDKLPEGWLFASNHPCESDHLQVVTAGLL